VGRRETRPYWIHSQPEPAPPASTGQQHPCHRGDWCSGSTVAVVDGEKITTPALCNETFCTKCRLQIWRALGDIPELWVRLHGELGVKGAPGERVSMSRSAPLPLRADVDALLREHLDILASWDERVRMAANLTLPDTQAMRLRTDHGRMVAAFTKTLSVHLTTLLDLPPGAMIRTFSLHDLDRIPEEAHGRSNRTAGYAEVAVDLSGGDAGMEILALHYRTRSRLGETRMTERLDVPCPDPACDLLMLVRVQGSDYCAECRACGRLLTAAEYTQWTKIFAATLSSKDIEARKSAA